MTRDAQAKAALRARIRAERRARSPHDAHRDAQSLATVVLELPEIRHARCVCLFVSVGREVDTAPLRTALTERGVRVLLPVVLEDGILDWAEDNGKLIPPSMGPGGAEPTSPRLGTDAVGEADALLIPALAVDTLGRRLGQGAGYYDRALMRVAPTTPIIALVHEDEVLDAAVEPIPAESHDLPVHTVATPRRCLRIR